MPLGFIENAFNDFYIKGEKCKECGENEKYCTYHENSNLIDIFCAKCGIKMKF